MGLPLCGRRLQTAAVHAVFSWAHGPVYHAVLQLHAVGAGQLVHGNKHEAALQQVLTPQGNGFVEILSRIMAKDDVPFADLVPENIENLLGRFAGIVVGIHAPLDDGHGDARFHPSAIGAARGAEEAGFLTHQGKGPGGAVLGLLQAPFVGFVGAAAPVLEGVVAENLVLGVTV